MNHLTRLAVIVCLTLSLPATDVYFTTTFASGSEAASTQIVLTVSRTPSTGPLTVNYTTTDVVSPVYQRADIGSDYTLTPGLTAAPAGELVFADGEASKTLTIGILNDGVIEGRQYIRLTLTSGAYNIVGAASSVQVTIADNDLIAHVANDIPLASENANLIGSAHDPGDARRGVMRVAFSGNSSFDKTIQAAFTGTALLTADYALSYKIGGNSMRDGHGFTVVAYAKGTTAIQVTGPNTPLSAGTIIRFSDAPTIPYSINAYGGGAGTISITTSGGLSHRVNHGTSISVDGNPTTTYTVAKTHPIGETTIAVTGGLGAAPDLEIGDVFHFGGSARYVVTTDLDADGVLAFRRYTGGTTSNSGLDVAINSNTSILTVFTTTSNPAVVQVPGEATRVEFGITPGSGGNTNDGIVEGAEFVTLALTENPDYAFGDPSTGAVTIADVDSTASIVLTSNAVEQDTPGTFSVSLAPAFTRAMTVPYSISGTALAGTDYTTLSGLVSVPAGGTGTITVQPLGTSIPVGGRTVIVTLDESLDYLRADGVLASSSATMTILPTTGTVSVATTADGTEGSATNASFRITLVRYSGHAEPVTIGYTIAGSSTATAGSDYTPLSGSVTIASGVGSLTADIPVVVTNDTLAEADETVVITLSTGSSYRLSGTTTATATIHDNEPQISVSAPVNANEGGTPGSFTIGYAGAARGLAYPVTFVLSGSATTPGDYTTTTPTTVTIPAVSNSVTVSIAAVDNLFAHTPARTVILTITPPGASGTFHVGTNSQTLSIVENEPAASVSAASGATATEGGSTALFTITLTSAAPTGGLTIPYTFSGAATTNYSASPAAQVVIAAGTTTAQVIITATDNSIIDAARTVTLTLATPTSPAAYVLGTTAASLALADNDIGVTGVSSTALNGTYFLSDTVPLTVTFSGPVTVSGIPTIALATGTARQATYVSGSGSATLLFSYVVQANDLSSDLDYASTSALNGTITMSGGSVVLTLPAPGAAGSLGANKALVIDGSLTGGKPAPGVVSNGSGGGCGFGSGFATIVGLFMLAGFALSIRRNRA